MAFLISRVGIAKPTTGSLTGASGVDFDESTSRMRLEPELARGTEVPLRLTEHLGGVGLELGQVFPALRAPLHHALTVRRGWDTIDLAEEVGMGKVPAYHSGEPGAEQIWHDRDDCQIGQTVLPKWVTVGAAGAKCTRCQELNATEPTV